MQLSKTFVIQTIPAANMPVPKPSLAEAFDPIKALFQNASTDEEYRRATMDSARQVVQTYFINPERFTLTDHGALPTPL